MAGGIVGGGTAVTTKPGGIVAGTSVLINGTMPGGNVVGTSTAAAEGWFVVCIGDKRK